MAVGAYAGAIFWKSSLGGSLPTGIAIFIGLVLAGIVAAIFGILIGVPALRLKGDYLAIITLGFGEIIRVCIINLPEITGGTPGMMGIPKHANFLVVYLAVVVTCMVIHLMMKSRHGRAILSIREMRSLRKAAVSILPIIKYWLLRSPPSLPGLPAPFTRAIRACSLPPASTLWLPSTSW